MRLFCIVLFGFFIISCGYRGELPSDSPLVDGVYQLNDDNNWPSQSMIWPMPKARLTQIYSMQFNDKHKGLDLASSVGEPIRSVFDGVVVFAGVKYSGYGNLIVIEHNDQLRTAYAHLNHISVSKGDIVQQGEVIGTVGSTGVSTGPHLHFEVIENGYQVNPLNFLDLSKLSLIEDN